MSPYATELAHARLDALRELVDALRAAEDPAEKRRCAVAIFNAPDPCDIDDAIELVPDDDKPEHDTTSMSDASSHATDAPALAPASPTDRGGNEQPGPVEAPSSHPAHHEHHPGFDPAARLGRGTLLAPAPPPIHAPPERRGAPP